MLTVLANLAIKCNICLVTSFAWKKGVHWKTVAKFHS
uniref:Uncharacterized protein n=1 Tax=Syphacia muris TaxID=451379 RepID=A0A0N5A8T9_9BILA